MSTTPVIRIRAAALLDSDCIAEFNAAMAWETEHKRLDASLVLAGVQSLMANPESGFYVVAECQDVVIGCLMVTFEWSDWRDGRFWWIQSVYVTPPYRRTGVFRSLYQHVHQAAFDEADVCGLRLYVEQDNLIAHRTYTQLGMLETPYRMYETEFDRRATSE